MQYKQKHELPEDGSVTIANVRRRTVAILIDFIVLAIIIASVQLLIKALGFEISKVNFHGFTHVEIESENMSETGKTLIKIIYPAIVMLYFTLFIYWMGGQTIGKKICHLKVLPLYEEKLGFWQCLERSLGYVASSLEAGLGFIQARWNQNKMALHDKIAGTIVIYTGKKK